VLGGSVYFGRVHRDAAAFLARHEAELAERPFAVFALGPKTAEPKDLGACRAQLDRGLRRAPEPLTVAVFGGAIRPDELRFPFSRLPASDARDWDAIEAWADEVGAALAPVENPQ
jgi:menaquinone-dependent protoporphyrinogen oxidase